MPVFVTNNNQVHNLLPSIVTVVVVLVVATAVAVENAVGANVVSSPKSTLKIIQKVKLGKRYKYI